MNFRYSVQILLLLIVHDRSWLIERFVWLILITNETLAYIVHQLPSVGVKFLEGQVAFSHTRLSNDLVYGGRVSFAVTHSSNPCAYI